MAVPESQENLDNSYGKPLRYDPQFRGPLKRRSCTDILCLLLFVIFLVLWAIAAVYGFAKGDPNKLISSVDSEGKRCGVDSEVVHKPYLFYFDLTACATPKVLLNGCPTPQVCLSECPKESWASLPYRQGVLPFNMYEVQRNLICQNEAIKKSVTDANILNRVVSDNLCADWYIASHPIYTRCLPTQTDISTAKDFLVYSARMAQDVSYVLVNSTTHLHQVIDFNELSNQMLEDLKISWKYMVIAVCSAVLISFVYIVLLRWIAGIITWITLIGIVLLFAGFAAFSFLRYDDLRKNGPTPVTHKMIQGAVDNLLNKKELWMFFFVMSCIFGLIALLIIVFLRKRIVIAITLIEEGSKAVGSVLVSLVFPVFPWIIQFGVVAWAIGVGVFLASVGNPVFVVTGLQASNCECSSEYQHIKDGDECNAKKFSELCHGPSSSANYLNSQCTTAGCHYATNEAPPIVIYMQLLNVFGAFWALWFVSGVSQMILAGTFATWYWTFDKSKVPFFTLTRSTYRTFRYHLGTIAFGSLIISICSVIRAFIEYTQAKLKKYDNAILRAIFCCMKCFFWCLEKFLKFINRNAYIMCAVHGKNFCTSAKDAFNLLMRNALRVVVLDKVTDFLFFLGKLVVTGVVVAGAYFLVFRKPSLGLHHTWFPLVIIAVFTFIIASVFFSVYTMAVNTLMLCFLEDCERNDGSKERPYFMSKQLMQILGKRNRRLDRNK